MRRLAIASLCAVMVLALVQGAFGGLSDEQFNSLKKRISAAAGKNPMSVRSEILDIAKDDSRRAVNFLAGINRRALDNMDAVAVIQQALASMRSDEARTAIINNTPKAADYRMRIILIEVCQNFAGSDVVTAIASCIKDRNEKVAMSAVRALGSKGSLDAVEPLIDQMEKMSKKSSGTRLYSDIRIALEKITGQKDLLEAQDWRNWFNANKDKIVPGAPGADGRVGTARPMAGEAKTVSFFGIQIDSRRIIFVIDVSGSMVIPDPPPENWVPDKELSKPGKGTTVKEDDPTLKKKLEKERDRMKDRKVWEKERQRIVRTKKELIRVLKALQGTVKFNIVAFSDEIRSFGKGLQKATASTKSKAVKWPYIHRRCAQGGVQGWAGLSRKRRVKTRKGSENFFRLSRQVFFKRRG